MSIEKTIEETIISNNLTTAPHHVPNPVLHLTNPRDKRHFDFTVQNLQFGSSILDVGCYDGWLDFLLIQRGYNLTGIELSPDLVQSANRYANQINVNYRAHCGLFHEIELKEHFDCILFYEVLEHVPFEMARLYIERAFLFASRVLISLPDCKNNPQHMWDADLYNIKILLDTYNYSLSIAEYKGTNIPNNFLISL